MKTLTSTMALLPQLLPDSIREHQEGKTKQELLEETLLWGQRLRLKQQKGHFIAHLSAAQSLDVSDNSLEELPVSRGFN